MPTRLLLHDFVSVRQSSTRRPFVEIAVLGSDTTAALGGGGSGFEEASLAPAATAGGGASLGDGAIAISREMTLLDGEGSAYSALGPSGSGRLLLPRSVSQSVSPRRPPLACDV